jgi:hypothetical protein
MLAKDLRRVFFLQIFYQFEEINFSYLFAERFYNGGWIYQTLSCVY